MYKNLFGILLLLMVTLPARAQTADDDVNQGVQLVKEMKEEEALAKFKDALKLQPGNVKALWEASLMSSRIGNRQTSKEMKAAYFKVAKIYAEGALHQAPDNADANLSMAIAMGRMALISGAKDKVAASRDIKKYADLAIKINPGLAEAWHVLGKWNFEITNLNFAERAAANLLFGGIPKASLADAIADYEKCKKLDPSFILNYYELARAYHQNGEDQKAIDNLKQIFRIANNREDDPQIKEDSRKLLERLQ